jgi:hypothetical protein
MVCWFHRSFWVAVYSRFFQESFGEGKRAVGPPAPAPRGPDPYGGWSIGSSEDRPHSSPCRVGPLGCRDCESRLVCGGSMGGGAPLFDWKDGIGCRRRRRGYLSPAASAIPAFSEGSNSGSREVSIFIPP